MEVKTCLNFTARSVERKYIYRPVENCLQNSDLLNSNRLPSCNTVGILTATNDARPTTAGPRGPGGPKGPAIPFLPGGPLNNERRQ